jgi:hypothetical protein
VVHLIHDEVVAVAVTELVVRGLSCSTLAFLSLSLSYPPLSLFSFPHSLTRVTLPSISPPVATGKVEMVSQSGCEKMLLKKYYERKRGEEKGIYNYNNK